MGRCTHGCFSPRVGTALTWWRRICFLLIPRCRTNMREFRTDGSWLSLWRGRKLPVNPHACPSSSVCAYSVRSISASGFCRIHRMVCGTPLPKSSLQSARAEA